MKTQDSKATGSGDAEPRLPEGDSAEAVPLCRDGAAKRPDPDSLLLSKAWALHDSGDTAEAAACFERLFQRELSRKPFTGFAYDELVRIFREVKNREALISVCERAVAAVPGDSGLLRTLGEAFLAAGEAAKAVRVFQQLTGIEPDAPEHWCSLGEGRLAAGDTAGAEAAYGRAAEIDAGAGPLVWGRLADALLRAGYPERATAVWERALSLRPDDSFFWMGFGDSQIRLGKADAAVEAYQRAVDLQPSFSAAFWNRLGHRFTEEGLHSAAAATFAKAAAAEPENPLYGLRLAKSYAVQGRDDLAAQVLSGAAAVKIPSTPGR